MFFPININLTNKTCLVVGAGNVAFKKITKLFRFGAKINVVAPQQIKEIKLLAKKNKITLYSRCFHAHDLKNIFLLILATNNKNLNKEISSLAKRKKILVNVVDDAKLCSFIMPAIIKRGDLVVSISTSAKAPEFSMILRKKLEEIITPEFEYLLNNFAKMSRRRML